MPNSLNAIIDEDGSHFYERFLGSVLYYLRDFKGMSAHEMAAKLNEKVETVFAYESGQKKMTVEEFCKIADTLEVDSGDLLEKVEFVIAKIDL